ncbi:MAG: 50S ribosomal protein L9 [Candidatus Omnitrophica bacterium]|nr:50S ribosomal protein L9 [Candidatus Omnitrophota bacterium]
MNIEVVLLVNDPKLGRRGDVIKVSSGFAQNFLYPNGKAKPATEANVRPLRQERQAQERQEAERLQEARQAAERLKDLKLSLPVLAGEGDKLFGAVTNADIAEALSARGIVVERKVVHLEEPIKRLGSHKVSVKLHPQVSAVLEVEVVRREG